jgi:transcriptional regulator with PAS, ATPase and Fis domain
MSSSGPEPHTRPDSRSLLGPVSTVLTALEAAWRSSPGAPIRPQLEAALCRLTGAISVHIRDVAAGEAAHAGTPTAVFEPAPGLLLEVTVSEGELSGAALAILREGALLAGLVLELDRWRAGQLRTPALGKPVECPELIGSSPSFRSLQERIAKVARTDFAVLIEGESGVGKELVARRIHDLSRRRRGPFVAVNCAAIVETLLEAELFGIEERTATGVRGRRGRFEIADGGTLFLDEVSDLSSSAQAKLLRVLQDMSVERVGGHGSRRLDVRIVAATNRNLRNLVSEGRFRLDLYYRLNCLEIAVPPLRTRRQDVSDLVSALIERHRSLGPRAIAPEALEALLMYDWPGNVRELERVLERAATLASTATIELEDLPLAVTGRYHDVLVAPDDPDETMRGWGSRYAKLVLRRCGGNKRRACAMLGISYHTLQGYLRYRPKGRTPPSTGDAGDTPSDTPSTESVLPRTDAPLDSMLGDGQFHGCSGRLEV